MKKMFRKALAVLCILGMLTSCATYSTLESVSTPYNEVYGENGESMQVVEDDRFLVSAEGLSIEDSLGSVIIAIGNHSDYDYRFNDDSIEFFGGNHETGEWNSLGRWSADDYYNYQLRNSSSSDSTPLFAFLLGVGVLGTVLDVYDGVDCYDFEDALFTTWLVSAAMDSGYEEDQYYLSSLEDDLLHTRTIYGREVYRGLVFFRAGSYPDYRILLHLDTGEPYELLFQRSDRENYL